MNTFRLIPHTQITAEMYQDYNINQDDFENKVQRWIERGIGLMHLDGYFEIAYQFADVEDYIAPLPCDSKYIRVVLSNVQEQVTRLPLTRDIALGGNFDRIAAHNTFRGSINFNSLKTNFEEGRVMYIYDRPPTDDEGNLLIPDNHEVIEALTYWIIYKMSLSGYKHPVISFDRAEAKWNALYPRARNIVNFPTIEEMHRFTQMRNNPIFLDIIDEEWNIRDERVLQSIINEVTINGGF